LCPCCWVRFPATDDLPNSPAVAGDSANAGVLAVAFKPAVYGALAAAGVHIAPSGIPAVDGISADDGASAVAGNPDIAEIPTGAVVSAITLS
jgi:hypothetical protein